MENEDGFYDLNKIGQINLSFYDADYWTLLHQNYNSDNYILATMTYNGEVYDSVGVQFKGETSYLRPKQLGSSKFSFDIKIDEFVEDQAIDGYSTLNLNNAFEDDSFMREIIYGRLAGKHIPAPRGNFISLSLNGENWGLYTNIQQVNNDLLREWFPSNDGIRWRADSDFEPGEGGPGGQWGDGTAALNYLGEDIAEYQEYYKLKSTDVEYPWMYLVDVCRTLNAPGSSDYLENIGNLIDLDATLWFLATEILFSDDDSYVYKGKNDYSLFYEMETGLMQPLEIDGNSILSPMNLNWSPFYHVNEENYPLLNRLLVIPEVRQRYLAHVRTILTESFNEDAQALIESLRPFIADHVAEDPKSSTTFSQFNIGVNRLKNLIRDRKNIILNNAEVNVESPVLDHLNFSVNDEIGQIPGQEDEVLFSCNATHSQGIQQINLYICHGLRGKFKKYEMTKIDGRYVISLNDFNAGEYVRFYIEAIAGDVAGTRSYYPAGAEHLVKIFRVSAVSQNDFPVVINELMADNSNTIQDPAGKYEDWIELYNNHNDPVELSHYHLSDKTDNLTKWTFPEGTVIEGNDYLIIWADEDEEEAGLHANFKLSRSGEQLFLSDPEGVILDEVIFGPQTTDMSLARIPNGTGEFSIQHATFDQNNDGSTATQVIHNDQNWSIHPNPARQEIIFSHKNKDPLSTTAGIFDMTGRQCYSGEITTGATLDISGLAPGLYVVRIDGQLIKMIRE
jgi:hypothetical protein